jgi:hypothetical protein
VKIVIATIKKIVVADTVVQSWRFGCPLAPTQLKSPIEKRVAILHLIMPPSRRKLYAPAMDRPNYRLQDEVACMPKKKLLSNCKTQFCRGQSNIAGRFQANPALLTDELKRRRWIPLVRQLAYQQTWQGQPAELSSYSWFSLLA